MVIALEMQKKKVRMKMYLHLCHARHLVEPGSV